MDAFAKKTEYTMYAIFRVVIGLFFAIHGASKLAWFGLGAAPMTGFMAFIGVCEFLIGLGVMLGLFTRLASIGGVIIMVGAYIKAHLPTNINPVSGGGEMALLFLVSFLVIFAMGAGKFSLNNLFFKKEML